MSNIFGGPPGDEGFDPEGFPLDYPEIEDPYGWWHGDLPDPWWYDEVTLYDDEDNPHTLTAEQWYEATLTDDEFVLAQYDMDIYDIIQQLENLGVWDADDWEHWYELYG